MEPGSDPAANLQEMKRSKGHDELCYEDAIDKIQTLRNSTGQAASVLPQMNCKGKEGDIEGN